MTDPAPERSTLVTYRVLLRLYPRSFRRAYGAEAERVVRDLLKDERGRGPLWLPRLWARVLGDLLSTAIRERGTQMKRFDWLLLLGAPAARRARRRRLSGRDGCPLVGVSA